MLIKPLFGLVLASFILGPLLTRTSFTHWFITPSQQGYWYFQKQQYAQAAASYGDPFAKGVAYYRDGDFKNSAAAFASVSTPEAYFNRGNALLMGGQYDDAIASYELALNEQPNWATAQTNLSIAQARRDRIKREGGEGTGGQLGADDIVFETGKSDPASNSDQTEQVQGAELSEAEQQAMWLRKVQTQPAQFLRIKFQYQAANADSETEVDNGGRQ